MPAAVAQSHCTEAARAASLASHSAASLAAAAGFREAARLLRSSEALARAATAVLLALPRPEAPGPGSGNGAAASDVEVKKKKRSRKKKGKQVAMEVTPIGPELLPTASGVLEAAPTTALTSTLSCSAKEFVPGKAARVLVPRTSRERSPRGLRMQSSPSNSTSAHQGPASASARSGSFIEGQAVVLVGLSSREDLVGKCGVVKFFDSASSRYAVCIDVTGEMVRVRLENLILAASGSL